MSYRTGWGFMVLTNMLPDHGKAFGGNGPFKLHAYALDAESTGRLSRRKEHHVPTTPRR